ncbi:MAG: DUF4417 domain-containing protein [Ruminococcus sp.]|nr:DUF4417 domain-containing protein [Ruminococcus sp.]
MYPEKYRYENLQHGIFENTGQYDIPVLHGSTRTDVNELVGFNFAKSIQDTSEKGLHFFVDDYQFLRLWNRPAQYIDLIKKFGFVLTPDFSLYTDFPQAMQIYNHYRKHWLGAFWENNGIEVIPTIGWSDERSFEWCFDGEPVRSTVAVSSIGTQNNLQAKIKFLKGYEKMCEVLNPETIIFYGNVPPECKGNIIKIRSFQERLKSIKQR